MSRAAQPLTCLECGMADPPPQETCTAFQPATDHRVGTRAGCRWCGRLKDACRRSPCTRRGITWRSRLRTKARVRAARLRMSGLQDRAAPHPPRCRAFSGCARPAGEASEESSPWRSPRECPSRLGTARRRTVPGVAGCRVARTPSPEGPPPARSSWLSRDTATWARMMTAPGP